MNKFRLWLLIGWFIVGSMVILSGTVSTLQYAAAWVVLMVKLFGDLGEK